jgi:hypothetical protein
MGKGRDNIKHDKVYSFRYANNWISRNPMGYYDIIIYILDNNKIVDILVNKWSKFS